MTPTFYIIRNELHGNWKVTAGALKALIGKPGFAYTYQSVTKSYLVATWDEEADVLVKLLQQQVIDSGNSFYVARKTR